MRVRRHYVISGRVQGVGFRWFVLEAAEREGVHGWVQNLPDRSVDVTAEGESEAIERFERTIRRGPSLALVADVVTDILEPTGRLTGFFVRG